MEWALIIGTLLAVLLGAATIRSVLRRSPREDVPFPDVPDAPRRAEPIEAPGVNPPYSSLDPFAPPKDGPGRGPHDQRD
jgi:hypothetical protein